ncbi:MAG: DUF401 family protein [Clostridiales bacterium]|nr:DUF401 family protein [Clostridiales bacterium]
MLLVKLAAVFAVILGLMWLRRPLFLAILGGIVVAVPLYGIPIGTFLKLALNAVTSLGTLEILLVLYLITYLQRMLEERGQLLRAQRSLNGIFNNRRINASLAPIFIGLLPSAAAVTICGEIVDSAVGDALSVEEKTFVTSYYRHIPESILPTYSSVIIACTLSGVSVGAFVAGMFPMVLVLAALGHFFYLRKVPRETGDVPSQNRLHDLVNLFRSVWTLFLVIALILVLEMKVWMATGIVLLLNILVDRFKPAELLPMAASAFDKRMISNTLLIFIFKDVLIHVGVIDVMPTYFARLPLPSFLVFALLFFFGTLVGGANTIAATCTALAFSTVPGAGMPLLVLLMGYAYAAMQLSPTHICLAIVTEYFGIGMTPLIRKTLPVVLSFCAILIGYYALLTALL